MPKEFFLTFFPKKHLKRNKIKTILSSETAMPPVQIKKRGRTRHDARTWIIRNNKKGKKMSEDLKGAIL